MTEPILAWHFLQDSRRLQYGRRIKPITVGETLTVKRKPVLCEWGLHASRRLIDALNYAPGNVICRVLVGGTVVEGSDKIAGTTRTVVAMIDGETILREWACDCAERALNREREKGREPDPRSWEAIAVARRYAKGEATKEELDAAWDAAKDAARDAAWAAAWDAAWAAARDAAKAAAKAAAWDAAWAAARDAAKAAEIEWQNTELERRVLAAMGITAEAREAVA